MMVSDFATDATGNTDSVENWTQLRRLFSDSRHNGIVEAKAFQITSWTQRSKSYWIGGNRLTAVTTLCTISGCEERGTDWRWCPCVCDRHRQSYLPIFKVIQTRNSELWMRTRLLSSACLRELVSDDFSGQLCTAYPPTASLFVPCDFNISQVNADSNSQV